MDTVTYEVMQDSDSPDKGQRDKRKILKYVPFGVLAVLLLLSASFIYRETRGNSDTLIGQENLTQTGEKTLPLKFAVFGILAALIFLAIGLGVSSIYERRGSLGPKNPRHAEGKTPQMTALMNFKREIFGLAIFFFLICLVYQGMRGNMEIFEGRENFLRTDEKTPPLGDFEFVMIGLVVVFLCLSSYNVFLLCSMRERTETFQGQENLSQSKEKFVLFGLLTAFLFLILFSLFLFCEMRGSFEIFEGIEYLRQTKNKTTSLMIFASATSGLLAVLLFALCGLISLFCEMLRNLQTLVTKENPRQTNQKTPLLKFLVFELLLVLLSLSFFSVFVFFEMREISEILEGKENIYRTEDKIPPVINKSGVLGHLAVLPFLKICLIFVFWEMRENLEIFMGKENPRQNEEKTTPLMNFKSVAFGIIVVIFFESLFSILMYYEMQGTLEILDGIESIIRTEEKTSPLMVFKVVAYGLMAVSFFLNIGLVFVFCKKLLYLMVFETQGNRGQADEKTTLMNGKFPSFGHFLILLLMSVSLMFCEVRRFMKMFEGQENLPQIEGKLFH